jgi:thiamine-monophosphate kinase
MPSRGRAGPGPAWPGHSAIDLSDGLLGDLGHVLQRSSVAACIDVDALPRSEVLRAQPADLQRLCLLHGGDDYELLFTAPRQRREEVQSAALAAQTAVTRCGEIRPGRGLVLSQQGLETAADARGFDHFA